MALNQVSTPVRHATKQSIGRGCSWTQKFINYPWLVVEWQTLVAIGRMIIARKLWQNVCHCRHHILDILKPSVVLLCWIWQPQHWWVYRTLEASSSCPSYLHHGWLSFIVSTCSLNVARHVFDGLSSLVARSCQEIPIMVRRHFWWNSYSLRQVSHACIVVGTTMDMYRWSLMVQLMEWLLVHIWCSSWKTYAAFPSVAHTSASTSDSLEMQLHRCWKFLSPTPDSDVQWLLWRL